MSRRAKAPPITYMPEHDYARPPVGGPNAGWQPRDAHRVCFLCEWVESQRTPRGTLSVGCTNPQCLRGQAGWGIDCCGFSRNTGCDDEPEVIDAILAARPRLRC